LIGAGDTPHFRASLPCSAGETAIIHSVIGSRAVLVVDDDPEFRRLARRVFAESGLTVIGEAASVVAARVAVGCWEPSAILIDVQLPDGDGVALARELTALPWRPHVVLTSGNADITTSEEVRSAGARAFVHKSDLPNAPWSELLGGD
jgi:CheY-like chemotaxis protein